MIKYILLSLLLHAVYDSYAQLPVAELYLVKYSDVGTKGIIRKVSYLSGFNPGGYNNQPRFVDMDRLYLTTDKYGSQTEVVELNLRREELTRITYTEESEYSPMLSPNGKSISVVRVESNGDQSLTLQSLQSRKTKRLLPKLADIGYYEWVSDSEVVLFRLPAPFTMSIADVKTGQSLDMLDRIGRCFRQDEDGNLYFVHKLTDTDWYVKKYDLSEKTAETVVKAMEGVEDFEILNDGSIIMAKGSTLYKYDSTIADTFSKWMELRDYGIRNISRMTQRRGQLVLVDTPTDR